MAHLVLRELYPLHHMDREAFVDRESGIVNSFCAWNDGFGLGEIIEIIGHGESAALPIQTAAVLLCTAADCLPALLWAYNCRNLPRSAASLQLLQTAATILSLLLLHAQRTTSSALALSFCYDPQCTIAASSLLNLRTLVRRFRINHLLPGSLHHHNTWFSGLDSRLFITAKDTGVDTPITTTNTFSNEFSLSTEPE
ncbi:hypothetical protein GGX14DRAFT_408889 [Mycena pura]|uniref:Uncharacterized protein n=1 Tax=Mycena pura TaxID=153505 RepID=A0AAD6UKB6_9AGAR|nr:hypothetical protein GGX14DRAFT_408889 [Mycena pura]